MKHYHILSGTTASNKPTHRFFYLDYALASDKFEELHKRYLEIHQGCVFNVGQTVHDMNGSLLKTSDKTNTVMYGGLVGQSFQPEYMISLYACDDSGCFDECN